MYLDWFAGAVQRLERPRKACSAQTDRAACRRIKSGAGYQYFAFTVSITFSCSLPLLRA